MTQTRWSKLARCVHSPLFWLVAWYVVVGSGYAWVTPMLEKPDEQGHYGHVLYVWQHRALAPLVPLSERSSVEFKQADLPSTRSWLAWELHQAPLYYVTTALLTSWLPGEPDPDQFFAENPQFNYAVPVFRNDNRNNFLHPPDTTPLMLSARLISLLFGLGTMITAYFLATQLFPRHSLVPIATAALVGFQPTFLFVATAASNDAAIAFFGALTVTILIRRLQKDESSTFAVVLGMALGLASITKESGLVFFPLAGVALFIIHRGFRLALVRDGLVIIGMALLVGGWWYARNALLYRDPLMMSAHPFTGPGRLLWRQIKYYVLTMEYTFWANQSITFVRPILFDQALIWWGRVSLGLFALGLVLKRRQVRAKLPALLLLLIWSLTFVVLLIVYWAPKTITPYGRLLFPSIAPLTLLFVMGWGLMLPPHGRHLALTLFAGAIVIIGSLIPFVTLYPLFHPSREWNARHVEHPVGTVYIDPDTRTPIAELIGYNLPGPHAEPGTYFPVELCWEPLGQTEVPYSVFVQLLDLGQLNDQNLPAAWGRRETYPGLGNRPTDRWALHKPFCDSVFVWVFPETPAPLGTAIEVGLTEPNKGRLQPVDTEGDPVDLAVVGHVPILSPPDLPTARRPARYTLDDSISLVQLASDWSSSLTLTLTWQSLRSVSYDATTFVHVSDANGHMVAQTDRQPLDGRLPTSLWLPGQIITDTINLPLPLDAVRGPLVLNVGMYTWPSMQRLPIKTASGQALRDDLITIDVP